MRGDVIFQVFGVHTGRDKDHYYGAFRSTEEAEAYIAELNKRYGPDWAAQYNDKGFVIRPKTVESDFELPPPPALRQQYVLRTTSIGEPGKWPITRVEVFKRGKSRDDRQRICEYERNYSMLQTFEPFRQGGRELALISREYTQTEVLDLASGTVIAKEVLTGSPSYGFCPVGFYVPDWWDFHHRLKLPGSDDWSADDEWLIGHFGFVWGCQWGDDSSWKIQYLDLSQVQEGLIKRDERFGYVELATDYYTTPCLVDDPEAAKKINPPSFIRLSRYEGVSKVTFAVDMGFDLQSGKPAEWERLRIQNFE